MFHCFYDGTEALGNLLLYNLESGIKHRIFKSDIKESNKTENVKKFMNFVNNLRKLKFDDAELDTIWNILAAIIIINDMSFEENDNELYNAEAIKKISENLNVDQDMLSRILLNKYTKECDVIIESRKASVEVQDAMQKLAITLYARLVDWIVNTINHKFVFYRTL